MNPHHNLPPHQRALQGLVDQWNADETLWRRLAPQRRLRRKLLCGSTMKQLRDLDQREHARLRPPDDCVGIPIPHQPEPPK
jgi:hypothetical protein